MRSVSTRCCRASPRRLALSLKASGLAQFFEGRCFTASEVQKGKPAPDLFLHAAEAMGTAPDGVRRAADAMTSPEPGEGVAEVIDALLASR